SSARRNAPEHHPAPRPPPQRRPGCRQARPPQRPPGRAPAPHHVILEGVGGGPHLRARAAVAPPLGVRALRRSPLPSFKNLGSLVTATIILDDSFLGDDNEYISDEDYCDGTTDDDRDDSGDNDWTESSKIHDEHNRYKDNYDYGGDIDSDDNTYAYSEIANDAKYGYKSKGLISSK
uniref:Uncharacterized protein n=1 Tax=Aegilops tauschii subsp. strangulata TaxID=200361 RepID=A0A453AS28_AEGTS